MTAAVHNGRTTCRRHNDDDDEGDSSGRSAAAVRRTVSLRRQLLTTDPTDLVQTQTPLLRSAVDLLYSLSYSTLYSESTASRST